MGRATAIFFGPAPWGPGALGRGQKVKYHLISITRSISKISIPNFVCVLTNERYKTYETGFILLLGSCPRGRTWGAEGAQVVKKKFFFKHGHVVYQIYEDEEHNRMQVKFYSRVKLVTLG